MEEKNVIIIPAYEPDEKLLILIEELKLLGLIYIIVIDDGSGEQYQKIFKSAVDSGACVFHHEKNMGKGQSIKTAISIMLKKIQNINGFITADSDNQHKAKDIMRVANKLNECPDNLILGVRDFTNKNVPWKSRNGNKFSSMYFKLTTGVKCLDTQTGLRGIPVSMTELALDVPGERYEYEMNFLIAVVKNGLPIYNLPIETVYNDKNSGSHFRTFADSFRIYKMPLKFLSASMTCALVDIGLFAIINSIMSQSVSINIMIATVIGRLLSGGLNFSLNKYWSFNNRHFGRSQIIKYTILFVAQMTLSWLMVYTFSVIPVPIIVIKIIVDCILFVGSYWVQKNWVFKKRKF